MSRQMARGGETLVADTTHMRFVTGVRPCVDHQGFVAAETLSTYVARVGFLAGMNALVNGKSVGTCKGLATCLTDVGPGPRVGPHVDSHITRLRKAANIGVKIKLNYNFCHFIVNSN